MTEQEAIAIIINTIPKTCKMANGRLKGGYDDWDSQEGKAIKVAIDVFEEIQQYRAIGTVDECRAAVETLKKDRKALQKQIPQKMKKDEYCGFTNYECPVCGNDIDLNKKYNYCSNCGQRLEK